MTPGRLDVVCTDRDRHQRTRLTVITLDDQEGGGWRVGRSFIPPDGAGIEPPGGLPPARLDGRAHEVFLLDCPRCPRTVELRPDTIRALVPELLALGMSRLDISRLPF